MASAEKVASLRLFAGISVPEARLRAALVRAGGNLDTAANVLLDGGMLGARNAPLQVPAAQSQSQRTNVGSVADKKKEAPSKPKSASNHRHATRKEWEQFYKEHYSIAIASVGPEKAAIYDFIKRRWRGMHMKRRQENLKSSESSAPSTSNNQPKTLDDQPSSQRSYPAQPGAAGKQEDVDFVAQIPAVSNPTETSAKCELTEGEDVICAGPAIKLQPAARKRERHGETPLNLFENGIAPVSHAKGSGPSNTEWPKKIDSRVCRGFMLTAGKNALSAGDMVSLEGSKPEASLSKSRGKRVSALSTASRIVRFIKKGREMGRLCGDVSASLGPALQSGFVYAEGKIILAPEKARIHAEVVMDLSVYITRDAFDGKADQEAAECGVSGLDSTMSERANSASEQGVDARRINVINLISKLNLCEPPEIQATEFPMTRANTETEDAGTIPEEHAEAYYRTVDEIDENAANSFQPPSQLLCTLREYQRAGVGWMIAREKFGTLASTEGVNSDVMMNPLWKKRLFPDGNVFFMNPTTGGLSLDAPLENAGGPYGGILADEMGLGKTIQCIACIVHDLVHQQDGLPKQGKIESVEEEKVLKRNPSSPNTSENDSDEDPDFGAEETEAGVERDEVDQMSTTRHINTKNVRASSNSGPKGHVRMKKPPLRRSARKALGKARRYTDEPFDNEGGISGHVEGKDQEMEDLPVTTSAMRQGGQCSEESDDDDWFEDPREERRCEDGRASGKISRGAEETEDEDWFEPARKKRRSNRSGNLRAARGAPSAFEKLMTAAHVGKSGQGGTLIVCPTSLVAQWMNELHQHVAPNFLRAVTYYGNSRGNSLSISLQCADVVVTTYGILAAEYSDNPLNSVTDESKKKGSGGPVFQLQWRRVILDEAHTIKSRVTKWARAAFSLKAEKRWCVTGTVIHNHVNDVFSLLHFLRVKPWSSWAFWNRGIVSGIESKDVAAQKVSMSLLRDIISSMTLRRRKSTKDSQGRAIICLPKKHVEIVSLIPSPEERDFYAALHDRTKTQFDTFVREGKVMKNYASILELLLRLRQACDHPYLVFAAAPSKDSVVMKDKDKLFKQFLQAGSSSQFIEKIFHDAESGTLQKSKECPLCLDVIDDAVAPRECGHPACRSCLLECVQRTKRCPVCRADITFESIATLPRATRFSVDLETRWRSSAKIDALLKDLAQIQTRRKQNGAEGVGKTVVFSQFTSMLDLVGMALNRAKIKSLRIDGSVPQAQRATILERFENEKELSLSTSNVLLVSLRAGGVGLNLCAASHAILLDIHWNPQVDAQAQDRVHRHGQTRDVVIKRYIVNGSVEEQLLKVQKRKQDIADGALGVATEEDKKQARLTELKLLFAEA